MPVRFVVAALGVTLLLALFVIFRNRNKNEVKLAPSTAVAEVAPPIAGPPSCTGVEPTTPTAHRHSVTLSWHAVIPASSSPRDAIKGYYVYRSLTSRSYAESNRISQALLTGTRCIDATVEPHKTYFYVVKAVAESGTQSGSSLEIRAVVPFP